MSALNWKLKRRIKISKQRQINIPKYFQNILNFYDETFVEYNVKEIVIRSARNEVVDFFGGYFAGFNCERIEWGRAA